MKCIAAASAAIVLGTACLAAQGVATPCCTITAIQPATGLVTAKVNANGTTFDFKVSDGKALAGLKVGQGVYANLTSRQVSLDGRATCCAMITTATPSTRAAVGASTGLAAVNYKLPALSYGTPQPATSAVAGTKGRTELKAIDVAMGGRRTSATIIHLRGLDGIEGATSLPEGARRLLEIHVRTLAQGEPDHYLVNPQLAAEWIAAHPVPASIKSSDTGGNSHSGCGALSIHCAGEVVAHAGDQTSKEYEKIRKQAQADWSHASSELTHDWNMVEDCFADKTLPLANIPVQFDITPTIAVDVQQSGSKNLPGGGSASGTVNGSVTLGFPMQSDFVAELDLFYIPCLPFAVRPRSISAKGKLGVGEQLTTAVAATGKFDKTFKIPPLGGPRIPIQIIPIVLGGVPIAELDVSAYIEGDLELGGDAKASAHFQFTDPHTAFFDVNCSGSGCTSKSQSVADPQTSNEGAQLQGHVFVKPSVYTALQLDFDFDALGLRAGPEPYLVGDASGCAAVAGAQTAAGNAIAENHVLAADLDWGVQFRAEALVGGQVAGDALKRSITTDKHLWFKDLAPGGSTAFSPLVSGATQVVAGRSASFKVRMPSCYPYANPVQYRVSWTGAAKPAATSACQWQAETGTCTGDPAKDLALAFVWPATGTQTVTVAAVSDEHDHGHRAFTPPPKPSQMSVTVAATPAGAP